MLKTKIGPANARRVPWFALKVPRELQLIGIPDHGGVLPVPRCNERECLFEVHELRHAARALEVRAVMPGTYRIGLERSGGARRRKDRVVIHVTR